MKQKNRKIPVSFNPENPNTDNMPAIRFPEFKGEWERKKLGEVAEFFSGGTPRSSNKKFYKGSIPFIRSGEIHYEKTELHISEAALKESSAKMVIQGDILFALYGATSGDVGICKINGAINQAVLCIRSSNNHKFMVDYLTLKKNRIIKTFLQGGQGNLSAQIIKGLSFLFPTLPEQKRIASFFTVLDKKIAQLQEKKALLEQYKKGVMQGLFAAPLSVSGFAGLEDEQDKGEKQNPVILKSGKSRFRQLRFKDENGKEFPMWEKKKLGEVGEFKNGINKGKEDFGFGVPFVNLMDVFGKSTISDLKLDLVNANEREVKTYELKKGDVLFIRSSVKKEGVGETSLVLKNLSNTVYSGFLIRFRDQKIKLDLGFKKYCFSIRKFREDLMSFSTTSANTNINQESLNELEISIPIFKEQTRIANFLSSIDDKINQTETQIRQTQEYKKGLLQRMFC